MNEKNDVCLKGGDIHITANSDIGYKIIEGIALIYILPINDDGTMGRRMFLCEVETGGIIPSLSYSDSDKNQWNFGIVALEKCLIQEISVSSPEKTRTEFAEYIELKNYEMEGFEEGLVEWYRLNLLKEEGFIHKTDKEQKQVFENSLNLIYNLFNTVEKKIIKGKSTGTIYDALNLLCNKSRIPLASYENIVTICKNDITVENIARISHFICRKIVLEENWYKNDLGSIIVFSQDEAIAFACIPRKKGGYNAYNSVTGEKIRITGKFAENMSFKAYMCYRPFDNKEITFKGLLSFGVQSINKQDMIRVLILTIIGSLIGLLIPTINQQLYDTFIPLGLPIPFIQMCMVVLAFMIGNATFSIVKNLSSFRMTSRITYDVQSAAYDRLFNLPESFFRKYDSGDLAQRAMGIGNLVNAVINMIISSIMTLVFCFVYFMKMLSYSGLLSMVGVAMISIYLAFSVVMSLKTLKYEKKTLALSGRTGSVMLQLLSGIGKIRIAGVEDRAVYEYLKPYTKLRELDMKSEKIEMIVGTVSIVFDTILSVIMYCLLVKCNINLSVGAFIAFTSAFGSFTASIVSLSDSIISANYIKPSYERIKDITETLPELDDTKELLEDVTGDIEISNVSFAYDKNIGNVLSDISLHIKPGEYVGIVGPSGCGKSTLLKLLLGFEKPDNGKIYYDNSDIDNVDKRELRKKLGVVLQDGKLIAGSIFENITITSPNSSYNDVEEVIKAVGLEQDISEMPMGLHTVLSEDCGTISGGQQQRILIARAIVGKPKVLFFDEATSALDNVTQTKVCESLNKLKATRLVIAHRLSTIINCDRIIVLDNGKVAEQGSYAELMERNGLFCQLASRQMT